MEEALHADICVGQRLGSRLGSINPETVNDSVKPELQYACRHWSFHTLQASINISDGSQLHEFLKRDLLHWIRALIPMKEVMHVFTRSRPTRKPDMC